MMGTIDPPRPNHVTERPNHFTERPRRLHGPLGKSRHSGAFKTAASLGASSGLSTSRKAARLLRPKAQVVTAIAAGVVLFAIAVLIRSASIVPPHPDLPPNMRRRRLPHPRPQLVIPYEAPVPGLTSLIAADGSHFLVDLRGGRVDIRHTGVQSRLAVHELNHRISPAAVPIAFFLQISAANLALLPRLLVILWHPQHVYLIHFDAKIVKARVEEFKQSITSISMWNNNVFFLPSDVITYKGVSMLLNTLSAMEFLLSLRREWSYFINLSGADYPLVNTETMAHLLGQRDIASRNVSFVQIATDKQFWKSMKKSRFDFIYYDDALAMHNASTNANSSLLNTWVEHPLKQKNTGVEFVQAEAWIIAHRSFVHLAVRSNYARKLLLLLSMMQDPEEHFFAMLAWNHQRFNASLAHHAFRAVYWELNGKMSGQHPYYIDQANSSGIYPFWEHHIRKSPCFFVRKAKHAQSSLLTRIDSLMSGTYLTPDMQSVASSHAVVRRFVQCISQIRQTTSQIRSYNVCY